MCSRKAACRIRTSSIPASIPRRSSAASKPFVNAVCAAKSFVGTRVGQIGTRPANFYTVMINEQELYNKFGIEVVPMTAIAFEQGIRGMVKEGRRVKEEAALMKQHIRLDPVVTDDALERIAAYKLFMKDWAADEGLSSIAIKCHDDIANSLQTYCCYANGELGDLGIPVACETDIHGALSMVMVQNASSVDSPSFLADLTQRHPTNRNSELLWHCGNFSQSLCKSGCSPFLNGHCNVAPGHPGTANFEIKGGNLTVAPL